MLTTISNVSALTMSKCTKDTIFKRNPFATAFLTDNHCTNPSRSYLRSKSFQATFSLSPLPKLIGGAGAAAAAERPGCGSLHPDAPRAGIVLNGVGGCTGGVCVGSVVVVLVSRCTGTVVLCEPAAPSASARSSTSSSRQQG